MIDIPTSKLHDGLEIPMLGLGTYKLKGEHGVQSLTNAIDLGYRLLDSAYNYENEGTIGQAVRETSVSRDDLIITSKLPGRYHEYDLALETVQESLYRGNLDYYDLYLIHWPNPITDKYVEAWQALIEAKKRGYVRSIGVCNFLPEHMDRLQKETGELPVVNQIELHPHFNQEQTRKWHTSHKVQTQSWSPLGRMAYIEDDQHLKEIAQKYDKTIAQIVLRWHHQLNAIIIPKSGSKERQFENMNIFDFALSEKEMAKINQLTRPDGRQNEQDPAVYEEF